MRDGAQELLAVEELEPVELAFELFRLGHEVICDILGRQSVAVSLAVKSDVAPTAAAPLDVDLDYVRVLDDGGRNILGGGGGRVAARIRAAGRAVGRLRRLGALVAVDVGLGAERAAVG